MIDRRAAVGRVFLRLVGLLALATSGSIAAAAGPVPHRVISMNVCTDQLAMLLAGKGQLYSVSHLAEDPNSSVIVPKPGRYRINHGLAEEIFLMAPDLVLAGSYADRRTIGLLRKLGIRVEEFAPADSLADIRAQIGRMGRLLGRQQEAAALVRKMDARLAALQARPVPRRTVALYYANSYTSGQGTLGDELVVAAGLVNVARSLGLSGTVKLPLETLVRADPDIVVTSTADYAAPALAKQDYRHPALRALMVGRPVVGIPAKYTICGAPFTLKAVRMMQDAARAPAGKTG